MSSRFAGIDYGTARIGLAVSDPDGTLASPISAVSAKVKVEQQIAAIQKELGEFDVDEWVVGLPLNMDGTEGPQANITRQFADHLAKLTEQPVHLWDERLSSHQADAYMAGSGLTRQKKKSRRDALAAQIILQSFLDAR